MSKNRPSLARGLTLVPCAALVVTQVIGTGVFLKARVMTCNVGTPWLVLLAYLGAGILTLGGALTFAELSAMMPRSGGPYQRACCLSRYRPQSAAHRGDRYCGLSIQ